MRQLLTNSYWVKTQYERPDEQIGAHVKTLYDEIGYPLTIQNVSTKPGVTSSIHNHGTWGVIFQIAGEDRHRFWQRVNLEGHVSVDSVHIEPTGEHILRPGDILSFHPNAIHQVETVGYENSLTFQLYGDTQPKSRFQFQPQSHTAKCF